MTEFLFDWLLDQMINATVIGQNILQNFNLPSQFTCLTCFTLKQVLKQVFINMKRNFGPCLIANCAYENVAFRLITELAYQKCLKANMLETYPYLEVGKQLCHQHYCKIVK